MGAVAGAVEVLERGVARRRSAREGSTRLTTNKGNDQHASGDAAVARPEAQLTYVPGLDGLRAISVLAVMLYHFRPDRSILRGGYLGVEVFFVISGYLITSLLLAERRREGRIALPRFWMRRIRRLWPALFTMLVLTGLAVAIVHHSDLGRLKGDLVFGFYAENWWHIFHGVSYFAQHAGASTPREPFQHLWSLAVEEQFYLVWPIELALGLFLLGRRRFRVVLTAQAALGFGLLVWLAARGSTNHAYLGTDTRMTGLLLGCLLAFAWSPNRLRGTAAPGAGKVLDAAAAGALVTLAVLFVTLREGNVGLYYWGLLLVDVATIVLIAAIMHPSSRANRVLGVAPLRAIGLRSYGIYLWGIAVFEFTRPGIDWHQPSWIVWLVRAVLVVSITEVSYRCIETPIRRGALGRAWRDLSTAEGEQHHRLLIRWQAGAVVVALLVAGLGIAAVVATDNSFAANCQITDCQKEAGGGNAVLDPNATIPTAPPQSVVPTTTRATVGVHPTTVTKPPAPCATPTAMPIVGRTGGWHASAVGDSVMLGASRALVADLQCPVGGPVYVNADVGRQGAVCVQILQKLESAGSLAPLVLVHCGNNGTLSSQFVDQVMQVAGPKRHVVFFTVKVPRGWEGPNNAVITSGAARYPNARVLDWNWFGYRQPASYFYPPENYHLTPAGRAFYAQLVVNTLHTTWHWI